MAPGIAVHVVPGASQRSHSYLNVAPVGVHVPVVAVRSWPTCAVPEIAGRTVLVGKGTCGGLPAFYRVTLPD